MGFRLWYLQKQLVSCPEPRSRSAGMEQLTVVRGGAGHILSRHRVWGRGVKLLCSFFYLFVLSQATSLSLYPSEVQYDCEVKYSKCTIALYYIYTNIQIKGQKKMFFSNIIFLLIFKGGLVTKTYQKTICNFGTVF